MQLIELNLPMVIALNMMDEMRANGNTVDVNKLEEELGVTLLVRSRSGVALTYEGRHLLPYIRDTVNAYRMLQSQAAGFSGLEQGTIRLGTFTSVSSFLLPPAMERFRSQHSGIRFELYQGLYYEIEDWVREGVVDFGFTDMSRTTPFACEPIYRDTMLAVLPEGHPLGENIFIQVDELAAEPFILLEEGRGGGCIRELLARHPQINVQYRVADDYTILNMVESRLGVSILPEAVLRRSGQRLTARRLSPELQRTIGVIYKQKTGLSTAGQLFLSELKASNPAPHG